MTSSFHEQTGHEQNGAGAVSTRGVFFGVPLGGLGFFTSVLMALGAGFVAFFLATFLAIIGIMIYNGLGHRADYADSYKLISVPIGCVAMAISFAFFGTLWVRRKLSGG